MTILAFEFSSARRSVALARHGIVLAEAVQHTESRATNAFGLIENVLAETKVSREAIEAIAVGLGPGSYTGIRAAIALAQGWQLARGIQLMGISSVNAIVAQAQAEKISGRVNVVIDAQRGEFYLAIWDISAAEAREIVGLKIVAAAEVMARLAAGEKCVGPEQVEKISPSASGIVRAAAQENVAAGKNLEPIYLRVASFAKAPPGREM